MAKDNDVKPAANEPILLNLMGNYMKKFKKSAPKDKNIEKLSQMPVQMKEDESEGEVGSA